MILVSHIIIALASMVTASLAFIKPSEAKLKASYGLIAATLVSGTYLVMSTHSALLSSCVTGLVYLGAVGAATIYAKRKLLAKQNNK